MRLSQVTWITLALGLLLNANGISFLFAPLGAALVYGVEFLENRAAARKMEREMNEMFAQMFQEREVEDDFDQEPLSVVTTSNQVQ